MMVITKKLKRVRVTIQELDGAGKAVAGRSFSTTVYETDMPEMKELFTNALDAAMNAPAGTSAEAESEPVTELVADAAD